MRRIEPYLAEAMDTWKQSIFIITSNSSKEVRYKIMVCASIPDDYEVSPGVYQSLILYRFHVETVYIDATCGVRHNARFYTPLGCMVLLRCWERLWEKE